jgi:hypothetical protein
MEKKYQNLMLISYILILMNFFFKFQFKSFFADSLKESFERKSFFLDMLILK